MTRQAAGGGGSRRSSSGSGSGSSSSSSRSSDRGRSRRHGRRAPLLEVLALAALAALLRRMPLGAACELQGYDSGECRDPEDFAGEMPFCASVVNYRACVPRYQGARVTRWRGHTARAKDQWVEMAFNREWDIRKSAETNVTLQELGIDETGNEGEVTMRFYAENEEDPWNFVNDCAQAYLNLFCWMNFPRCDEEDRSLIMCRSACENYFKSCGYPKDMWRCGQSDLVNGYEPEAPLLFKEGLELDIEGFDENGIQYFLRSFFPGQPFRDNQFEEDGETPIAVCTPSIKNAAPPLGALGGASGAVVLLLGLLLAFIA
mmetsp:Transcript_117/g.281  ORF Transcript_117/g.281 Transcript_117/m.281 type:complete len:317 (+) Transcript_117:50-1000(+)|eukprot:CAMPEP_0202048760 /NCGR_PEP_ID=MMETSP0963-20130614/2928_1 /ASSEMBLY_ACC=CAM_ASM_000494 /TAXON_ID=4773 /ORGANISM="Schizochytrium aggregatum, Strain ATCC28209" /LENGTH=316 /DNA_ID=CAMNT_0048613701 /DNA_START=39 /DNA_END=989 /DNA_ORIENTATION=+